MKIIERTRLEVGTVSTFKWLEVGTVPTFRRLTHVSLGQIIYFFDAYDLTKILRYFTGNHHSG